MRAAVGCRACKHECPGGPGRSNLYDTVHLVSADSNARMPHNVLLACCVWLHILEPELLPALLVPHHQAPTNQPKWVEIDSGS